MTGTTPAQRLSLHGLRFESFLPLPGLAASDGIPDVRVVSGAVPDALEAPVVCGGLFQASPGRFLLRIPGVVAFLVSDGREIIVDADASATTAEILTFLLGTAVAAALHQRGHLVLHASAVAGPAGAVLLLGHSGRGKSTLTAALAARGYRVLTDDVAVVTLEGGIAVVHPGVPQVRLWAETLQRFGMSNASLVRVRRGLEKFVVPLPGDGPSRAMPLKAVWALEVASSGDVSVEPVEHSEAFHVIRALTRNLRAIEGLGVQAPHFLIATAVAGRVPVRRLWRPRGMDTIEALVARVEETLR